MIDTFTHALDEFVHSPVEVLAALVVIAGAGATAFKGGRRFWMNIWRRLRSKPIVPSETLRIVQDFSHSRWGYGHVGGATLTPAMQVVFEGHVTSISDRPNRILRVEIPKPLTHALIVNLHDNQNVRRPQVLMPHECTGLNVMFCVQPVVGKEGKSWQTSLIFIDQYGNRHKVKNCMFKALPVPKPPASMTGVAMT